MSRVAEMRGLTDDLLRSYEQRMAGIASRQASSQDARSEIRQQMAARHGARIDAAVVLNRELAEDAAARRASVANTLAEACRARGEMAAGQQAALARATADRQAEVGALHAECRRATRKVRKARLADEASLKAELHRNRVDLFQQVSDLVSGIGRARAVAAAEQRDCLRQGHAQLEVDTAGFLGAVRDAREAMAKSQKEAMAAGRAELHAEVNTALGGFRAARESLAANLAEFDHVWQGFAETMRTHRTPVVSKSPSEAETKVRKAPVVPVVPPEAVPPGTQAQSGPDGLPSDDTVFRYLADHPDGLRLVEMEEHFRVVRIRMANILNRLIEENKARKDEERKLYFAS